MRIIKLFTAAIALLSPLIYVGCDSLDSLTDLGININANTTVDIPVQLDDSNTQTCEFSISLEDIDDLNKYLGKPKELTIKDIELSVINYSGDNFNGDIALMIGEETLWSRENVNMTSLDALSLKSDAKLNGAVLNQFESDLHNEGVANGRFTVETANSSPVTAGFTVRCDFTINVVVNPLDSLD